MGQIEDIKQRLENIESMLKSVNYQLSRLVDCADVQEVKSIIAEIYTHPRMFTTKEVSQIFGLS